jgi:hypothetical protein
MITISNLLHFSNFIALLCFFSSSIVTYIDISNNYVAIKFIVATFNLSIALCLSYIQYNPYSLDKYILAFDTNKLYVVNFFIQFICGIFMIGLGKTNIGFGIITIIISFYNIFYAILYEETQERLISEEIIDNNE